MQLFDRRFGVYEATMKFVSGIVAKGDVADEGRREFAIATRGVVFLFDKPTQDYCDHLARESINVQVGKLAMDSPGRSDSQHQQSVEAWAKRMEWFTQQLDEIPKRYGPFLRIVG
jgi:hypothetical protein